MKRMVLVAGIALSIFSCAQHDPNSPATSGTDPQNPNRSQPVTTGDTANNTGNSNNNLPGSTGGGNMNNDHSNNNQQVNTADSSTNKNRNQ